MSQRTCGRSLCTTQLCKIEHHRARVNGGEIGSLHRSGKGGLCSGLRSRNNSTLHALPDSHFRLPSQIAVFGRRARFRVLHWPCRPVMDVVVFAKVEVGGDPRLSPPTAELLPLPANNQRLVNWAGVAVFHQSRRRSKKKTIKKETYQICYVRHGHLLSFSVGGGSV
ncbi:hypothetical protein LX32DRAFT_319974 [Colletotrichum zoysiae]|uniref:Uncharacterized protein n=1 Tax=Colletotrichum zoysiae TaxID=1216348 RepID=A0AAD9M691_9PEZI|nr:hypothetical protein LX32DRAFT_319974 [Colletotrichum zoysiae]